MMKLTKTIGPGRTRNIVVFLFIFLLLSLAYWLHVRHDMSDFGVCYKAGERLLLGETLYRVADGHLQYKYAPVSVFFFSVLNVFPYEAAKVIWYFLQFVFLYKIMAVYYGLLPERDKSRLFIIGCTFLVLAKFIGREVELGQVNLFILCLLVLMIQALAAEKWLKTGILWGVSLLFKPYAFVFLPYFLLKKKFKASAIGLLAAVVGLFAPVLFYGFRGNVQVLKEWTETLSLSTPGLMAVYDNASLFGFITKFFGGFAGGWSAVLFGAVFFLIGLGVVVIMVEGRKSGILMPELLECAFLLILIPMFSPLGWNYTYLFFIPFRP